MTENVLYIEDNEANIEIVTHILERAGFNVHIAERGDEGIDKAQDIKPELILVDLHLPGMNGLEITERLRSMPELDDAKIMLLTADIYSRDEAKAAGADDFMAKPIRRKTFLRKVNEILGKTTA